MLKDEYLGTIVVKDTMVNIGKDDYGQQYFYEYYDKDKKEIVEYGCGVYNMDFLEIIYSHFDPKGTRISMYGIEAWKKSRDNRVRLWQSKGWDKEEPEEYKEMINSYDTEDYELYDFDKLYKNFNKK